MSMEDLIIFIEDDTDVSFTCSDEFNTIVYPDGDEEEW